MKKLIFLVIALIVLIGVVRSYWLYLLSPLDPKDQQFKLFVIEQGESVSSVAKKLENQKLIRSADAFTVMIKRINSQGPIQAGDFKVSPSMSAREIYQKLQAGPIDRWVTLLEGWRIEEMAEKLQQTLKIDKPAFLEIAKEGYMFPDTYLFNPDASPSDMAKRMRDNFDQKYDQALQNKIRQQGLTPQQGVILASIVEREGRSDEVRRMVASILLKRLKINMGLNADATIQYALVSIGAQNPPANGWWKKNLTKDDLKILSPYNTYIHAGLPPAPISNPGLSSLQAVANADSTTPYLYYYHDSQGRSHYAKTLEEHNQNIAQYP